MSDPFTFTTRDHSYMRLALEEAKKAAIRNEVPIGAVLVHDPSDTILAQGGNKTIGLCDPSAHAEMLVIRAGCEIKTKQRVPDCILYVTLEPCTMCAAAISFARIKRVIFGAPDPKGGGVIHGAKFYDQPTCHHKPEVQYGLMEAECGQILRDFFKEKRKKL